ncbi:Uncharacterized [Syntrophomonas zehnderi OL-4]|uniref:Uncharacterized n=1 Tax=Syntrophomonas zehnderi OL-4 TaxID=690567 RepID=A0A0E3W364_9FIRM|nr:hypothetical protein [Syntrophomonas zehnderi]CFX53249.1 Uncharacterized [Syntrophomonas zehnderi OL-4]
MRNKWGKGDPVNLSDLLRITPVANEILHLSDELNMTVTDVMWIVAQILENSEELENSSVFQLADDIVSLDDEWDESDLEALEEELDQSAYLVNVKINGTGRFPEIGFKAGINDKEDMNYFFDMIVEMLDRLDG